MIGRPSVYTSAIGDEICERISAGETLTAICRDEYMPHIATVLRWESVSFRESYARAKELRLEVMAEEIQRLSDECRPGEKVKRTQVGWECKTCGLQVKYRGVVWLHEHDKSLMCEGEAKPARVYEEEIVTGDMVDRAKLQVDTRKWLLARLAHATYGDRQMQPAVSEGGNTVQLIIMPSGTSQAEMERVIDVPRLNSIVSESGA